MKIHKIVKSVSIITAIGRKEADYLSMVERSIYELAQELPDWSIEWLIAVDGVAPEWVRQHTTIYDTVRIIEQGSAPSHTGPAFPRNRALREAKGVWLITLDADDVVEPDGMAKLLRTAHTKNVHWAAGKLVDINAKGEIINRGPHIALAEHVQLNGIHAYKQQHGHYPFHCCAGIMKTATAKLAGGWAEMPELASCEDMALWFRITAQHTGLWLDHVVFR